MFLLYLAIKPSPLLSVFLHSAVEEQKDKGVNNDIEWVPDTERET